MDIAGHVSRQMLKHYSHIRMEAKWRALESIVAKADPQPAEKGPKPSTGSDTSSNSDAVSTNSTTVERVN